MIPQISNGKRRLVPRWRSLQVALKSGELDSPRTPNQKAAIGVVPKDLKDKLALWRQAPSIATAGELVESALVEGKESEGVAAARFLLSPTSTATPALQRLANVALGRSGYSIIADAPQLDTADQKRIWRQRTREYPQNALAWTELSFLDIINNQPQSAERSMRVALQLAPENRHILRSAARLFLHLDQVDRAYALLARSDRTRYDPWLIAAEISIADLAGKSSRFVSQGRQFVEGQSLFPRQLTELASALATVELEGGRRKKARDYFQRSLIDPNGNVLAQVEWAAPKFGNELVSQQQVRSIGDADEAIAIYGMRQKDFPSAIVACRNWSSVEPYSVRPLIIGAIATSMIEEFDQSLAFTQAGLAIRPKDEALINARAFCLASTGQMKEASTLLAGIERADSQQWFVSQANRGLIEMRSGQVETGVALYRDAAKGFRKLNNAEALVASQLYMVREASRAGIKNLDKQIIELGNMIKKYDLTQYNLILETAARLNAANNLLTGQVGPLIKASLDVLNWPGFLPAQK